MSDTDRSTMPDQFDRLLGALDGLPGVLSTSPATIQLITPLLGTAQTFIVRTVRQQERVERNGKDIAAKPEFTVFLEHVSRETGHTRLVLSPKVSDLIARQRDALTTQANRRVAKRVAAERKARGEVPGFLRKRKK